MKKSLIGALLISYLPFAKAATLNTLVTISNDRSAVTNDLDLVLDASATVHGIAYLTNDAGKIAEQDFPLSDLGTPDGAVLVEEQGVKALQLMGHIDMASGTGHLVIHYVNNGLTGVYKDCKADVARESTGLWHMINAYTKTPITNAKIITSSFGISTIQGICP
jgi:hypothetical protein